MTCRDRTAEFFRIVEEERLKRQGAGAAQGNRQKPLARRSEFMNIAKAIGKCTADVVVYCVFPLVVVMMISKLLFVIAYSYFRFTPHSRRCGHKQHLCEA